MFCPKCGDEFRPGYSVCPDCQVPLGSQPPQAKQTPEQQDPRFDGGGEEFMTRFEDGSEEFVTVATFENQIEASVAKGGLEAEGIPAFVPEEYYGAYGNTPYKPWAELKVRARDRARAVEMLKQAGHR